MWCRLFFFCPSTLRTATNCLDHQKASLVTGGPKATFGSPVTKDVFGQDKFSSQPRSPYGPLFCSSLSITIEKGWALASVKCAWWWDAVMHKRPLVASVLRVMVEGLLGTFCPVDSGKESTVWETHAIHSFSELTRLPLQWSDVATLIDTDFCNMHKRDTQLKRCEAADQESVAALLFQNWKGRKFHRAVGARWFLRWCLQAVLVRDDALDLTLSSSGFGTFQLEAVMFRNPNWFVYRTPLRSSFCACLSLSMSCDVVCFFSARPPCGQPQTALTIRRLLWSQEVQRPPSDLLWPKTSSDKTSSAPSRAALILQQFVYHNRERMGVGFSQVCMVVRCGDAQEAACCECFACDGGGPSWNFLSCRFWQGVYSVRNARYTLLFRVDKAPPAMVGCGHTHWHRLLQYAQKRHATETLWGSRSGECGGAVVSELKRQKVPPCGWCPVVPAMVFAGSLGAGWCPGPHPVQFGFRNISAWSRDVSKP